MKFKATITKEVIDKSLMCGLTGNLLGKVGENCAYAVILHELIPNCLVGDRYTSFYAKNTDERGKMIRIGQTKHGILMKQNIQSFDSSASYMHYKNRYDLVGKECEITIPKKVLEEYHGTSDPVEIAKLLISNEMLQPICKQIK